MVSASVARRNAIVQTVSAGLVLAAVIMSIAAVGQVNKKKFPLRDSGVIQRTFGCWLALTYSLGRL